MEDQTTVALLAHGMLTSLSVVRASLWLTATSEDGDVRERVMEHGMEQITLISDILVDLARGLSPEALDLLQEVRRTEGNNEGRMARPPHLEERSTVRELGFRGVTATGDQGSDHPRGSRQPFVR